MSSWLIATLRGRHAKDYEYTRDESHDRWHATADIVATMDADGRVREWTTWKDHAYAYLSTREFEDAEELLADYEPMVDDAVLMMANDTADVGTARYYPRPAGHHSHQYSETQSGDGVYVGHIALAVINSHHGIVARDPFHNAGWSDDNYLNEGKDFTERGKPAHD